MNQIPPQISLKEKCFKMPEQQDDQQSNIFLDRCLIEDLPSPIAEFILRNGLVSSINGNRISFCGLINYEGVNYFFYPRQTDLKEIEKDPFSCGSILMRALLRFARESQTRVFSPEDGYAATGFDKLQMFKSLIQDFQQNGIFKHEEITTLRNMGKADWRRTMHRSPPYPDKSNTPIYLDIYGKKKVSVNNEITKIHADILSQIFKKYGFIFSSKNKVPFILKQYGNSFLSIESKISLLKNEIRNHYADRQITLLKMLINYLTEYKGKTQSNNIIGVTNFHVAWEHILYRRFTNVIDINSRLPKPIFINTLGKSQVAKRLGMRTDIVIEDASKNLLIVLDAKYYEATSIENSPGWSDLVKQFFYEKALEELSEFSDYTIKNGLIFPGKTNVFTEIRMQDQKNSKYLDEKFPPIKCMYCNPFEILQDYLNGKKVCISELIAH